MKKLLTKLTAFAIAGVMISGISAFAYTDMPDTEKSIIADKLGIMQGFEDGTFRPDELVTRAEAAKIIIFLLNEVDMADDVTEDDQTFSDVTKEHWAYKYILQAYGDRIVAGYGDGTFRPEETITFEQLQTMLVCSVGAKTYAEGAGGYPNGYLTWAKIYGIIDDTLHDTAAITRKELLDYVIATLNVPLTVIEGYDKTSDGRRYPVLKRMDGTGKDFTSLMTRRYNTYKVTATVTGIKDGTVDIRIINADTFDDEYVTPDTPIRIKVKLNADETTEYEADKNYTMYIKIIDSDNEEYEIIYAEAQDK